MPCRCIEVDRLDLMKRIICEPPTTSMGRGYNIFAGVLIVVIVICFGTVWHAVSRSNAFEAKCLNQGGYVARPGKLCVEVGAVIVIKPD